jgi:DnaK suppressor protein
MLRLDREEFFREMLVQNLQELLGKSNKAVIRAPEFDDRHPDFCDMALSESNSQISFHISERQSRLIDKIEYSLEKLKNGEFGICEECGEEISEQRLIARPVASLCIECKRNQEKAERNRGF